MKNKGTSNKFQNYKKINNSFKLHQNNHNNSEFPTGNLSFQASQKIGPDDEIALSVSTIKHFYGRVGEKYTLQKKSNTSVDPPNSQDVMVNVVMETINKTETKTNRYSTVSRQGRR